jgi:chromate transporter
VGDDDAAVARPGPRSATELFITYAGISLQSFGGALAVVERTIVRSRQWLDAKEFVGVYAISQVLPGPTGISLCVLLGDRFFGLRGAAAALAGFLLLPSVLVLGIASLFLHFQHLPWVQGALHGMGAASVGMIVHTALRMSTALRGRPRGIVIAVLAFAMLGLAKLPVGVVVLTLGVASVVLAWFKVEP